jgi:hypothetical protein
VISLGSVPGGSRVAGQARVRIAAPCMLPLVVGLMTSHAVVGRRGLEERVQVRHRMACRAVQQAVIADQREPA